MFRKEFADVIAKTGMIPLKDLRPLLQSEEENVISEQGLVDFEFFNDIKFAKKVAEDYGLIFIDLTTAHIPEGTLGIVKKSDVIKYRILPIKKIGKTMTLATFDPSIVEYKKEIQVLAQHDIEFILTGVRAWFKIFSQVSMTVDEIASTVQEVAISETSEVEEEVRKEDIGDDVVQYVNRIFAEAHVARASDIHVEPYESTFRIRFRVDGVLIKVMTPPKNYKLPIISRLKIMAQMDISEKRRPQDGRIKLNIGDRIIDYRVSALPTLFGEKIVMRVLDTSGLQLDMTKLGFEEKQLKHFKKGIHLPFGMCLVAAPTGSGKTTTLYSALQDLNDISKNISTVEDPVEYNFTGINQVNVKKDIGLNFASALRTFLRQDPDIILVGEIRDVETAEIAIEAALTGHLVLSTIHTNNAPATITRLLNMEIEPFLISSALNVVVAQRLCRKICDICKTQHDVPIEELVACGLSHRSAEVVKPQIGKGCESCNGTGYRGRVAIYEVMPVSAKIVEMILKCETEEEIKKQAIRDGMKTLRMSALSKVAKGITTLHEALSNTGADEL